MGDFEIVRSDSFVTIANSFLKDKNLSNKAKGVLAMILALPPTWDFSIKGMVAITKDGEASLRAAINEMKDNGYCAMKPVRINNKIARWKYLFSGEKLSEKLLCDFLHLGFLLVENRAQNNIYNENNKELYNNKENKKDKNKFLSKKVEEGSLFPEVTDEKEKNYLEHMHEHYPLIMKMDKPLTYDEFKTLRENYDVDLVWDKMDNLENTKNMRKKYVSAYLTLNNWCKMSFNRETKKKEDEQ